MITRQDLREVLQKQRFSEQQIEKILNKRIKTLLEIGNKENIDTILEILLDERKISQEKVEGCLSVLAFGKEKEIKEILDYLIDERKISQEKVEGCLSVLARGKAKEIKEILKYLIDERKISQEKVEGCLTVLALGKAKEIKEILDYLIDERKISQEKVEECLSVLARGKVKEIKKIFEVLDSNQIRKEQIENNLGYLLLNNANEVNKIFDEGSTFLKKYMQIKGIYDSVVTEEEIQYICEEKKISQSEFMRNIRKENFQELYQETLKRKRGIYIGKSIPMKEDFINKNGTMLLEIARTVSKNFGYRYRMNDLAELESQALEIMITKCGDIAYNIEWNSEILRRLIYKKTFNYLKVNLNKKEILQDFSTSEIERNNRFSNTEEKNSEELDLSKWNINEEQKNILKYISKCLEEGEELSEAIGTVANILNIDEEEILEEIENIREQNKIRKGEENELS